MWKCRIWGSWFSKRLLCFTYLFSPLSKLCTIIFPDGVIGIFHWHTRIPNYFEILPVSPITIDIYCVRTFHICCIFISRSSSSSSSSSSYYYYYILDWQGIFPRIDKNRTSYKNFLVKIEGIRTFGKPCFRWEY